MPDVVLKLIYMYLRKLAMKLGSCKYPPLLYELVDSCLLTHAKDAMIGDPEFVILKYQSWLDTVKFEDKILGSVVKEFLRPTNNYLPESPLQYNTHDLIEGSVTDFVLDNSGSKSQEATASLKSVAGVSFKGNTENTVHLTGKLVRYKRLQQHDQFWGKLKTDSDVRATVSGWISRFSTWPVCLVVGIMICEDVELSFEGQKSLGGEGKVELPIGKISLAAGTPIPGIPNPEVSVGTKRQTVNIFRGRADESRIFALELRKIGLEGWFRKDLRLRSLGPEGIDETRLAAGEDEDEEYMDGPENVNELVLGEFDDDEYRDMEGAD